MADGQGVGGIGPEIVEYADAGGMLAGQEGGPIRGADGSGGVGMSEANALLGQLVEVRRFVEGVAIAGELRPTEVVGQHVYDVGFLLFRKGE